MQVLATDLHAKVASAHAGQQTAQEALHTAELNLQKEAATRGVLESTLDRAHRELAVANEERCAVPFSVLPPLVCICAALLCNQSYCVILCWSVHKRQPVGLC